jgi:AGZA family xanthine/uracil permease-like MFS transporter
MGSSFLRLKHGIREADVRRPSLRFVRVLRGHSPNPAIRFHRFASAMPKGENLVYKRYAWIAPGDVNAFFGLMLDNIGVLILAVSILGGVFSFPATFALRYMVPGTMLGVLVGDVAFTALAFWVARRTGRNDVTAMPLGIDTPSTFGMVFFVLGPAFRDAKGVGLDEHQAALLAWHIGIWSILWSGLFKLACAPFSGWVHRLIPRAGLLGSLAAIALVLIAFLPLVEIWHEPLVGLPALAVILCTLVARKKFPFKLPGALAALLIGGAIHYFLLAINVNHAPTTPFNPADGLWPTEWLTAFRFEWWGAMEASFKYLPIVLPFALATVVGGIDCTESAKAVGDEYHTGTVIGIEAVAAIFAALCGGVVQTTPYIGHPAYKAMGGRAGYTLATALFIGSAGIFGYFAFLYLYIPRPTVFPILVFIGLEISSQSFLATPKRHYPAVAIACIPALALLGLLFVNKLIGTIGPEATAAALSVNQELKFEIETLRVLSNGFIVTSVIWASALAAAIDRQLFRSAAFFAIAALLTTFGVMHSPLESGGMYWPWNLPLENLKYVAQYAAGYALVALLLVAWGGHLWYHRIPMPDHAEH